MGKADYLKYDTEQMAETRRIYKECIFGSDGTGGLLGIQAKMQVMVDEVKEAWQSEAGEAFFDKYNNEWLKGFVHYQEVLEHMADRLDVAERNYSEITRQAEALKIKE